jgi:hypothetical protein
VDVVLIKTRNRAASTNREWHMALAGVWDLGLAIGDWRLDIGYWILDPIGH